MRRKENANDYRYFPDPDLAPIVLSDEVIAGWRKELPQLPDVRKAAYMADYGLTAYAAEQLVSSKYLADYFETAAQSTTAVKMLANLMISEVFRLLDGVCMACHKNGIKKAEIQEQRRVHLTQQAKKHGLWRFDKKKKAP